MLGFRGLGFRDKNSAENKPSSIEKGRGLGLMEEGISSTSGSLGPEAPRPVNPELQGRKALGIRMV